MFDSNHANHQITPASPTSVVSKIRVRKKKRESSGNFCRYFSSLTLLLYMRAQTLNKIIIYHLWPKRFHDRFRVRVSGHDRRDVGTCCWRGSTIQWSCELSKFYFILEQSRPRCRHTKPYQQQSTADEKPNQNTHHTTDSLLYVDRRSRIPHMTQQRTPTIM